MESKIVYEYSNNCLYTFRFMAPVTDLFLYNYVKDEECEAPASLKYKTHLNILLV